MLANNETSVIDEICESRAIRMLVDIRTEFSIITAAKASQIMIPPYRPAMHLNFMAVFRL
jgi:hypothetical protein